MSAHLTAFDPALTHAEVPNATIRAQALLNQHIADLDAASARLGNIRHRLLGATADCLDHNIRIARARCVAHLGRCNAVPRYVLGKFGENGAGPRIADIIRQVRFYENRERAPS